jgi:hypothetical protein
MLFIILSLLIVASIIFSFIWTSKQVNRLDNLLEEQKLLNLQLNQRLSLVDQKLILRIDNEIETLHELIRQNEIEGNDNLKKQIDSLTNQIIKKIPPTNDELMKRIEDLEEGSHRLRMNM